MLKIFVELTRMAKLNEFNGTLHFFGNFFSILYNKREKFLLFGYFRFCMTLMNDTLPSLTYKNLPLLKNPNKTDRKYNNIFETNFNNAIDPSF